MDTTHIFFQIFVISSHLWRRLLHDIQITYSWLWCHSTILNSWGRPVLPFKNKESGFILKCFFFKNILVASLLPLFDALFTGFQRRLILLSHVRHHVQYPSLYLRLSNIVMITSLYHSHLFNPQNAEHTLDRLNDQYQKNHRLYNN